jgi:hypothetical protein
LSDNKNRRQWIFESEDYHGIPVGLSQSTWKVKAGNAEKGTHPEIRD